MSAMEIKIKETAIAKVSDATKHQLFSDIETIKTLETNGREITGKTAHGFYFRKMLHCIVVF